MRNAWTKLYGGKQLKNKQVVTGYKSNVQGWRTIGGKKHYFRSLWEIQFAQYLQWSKDNNTIRDWAYEPKLFRFPKDKYRSGPYEYLPDFLVTEQDGREIWYEVKGYMNAASKKKTKRFRTHYPDDILHIIDKKWFIQARRKKLHLIIGFEKLPTL